MQPSKQLNSILTKSTVFFWNSAIRESSGDVLRRNTGEALILYREMKRTDILPDNLTFPFLLKSCTNFYSPNLPQMIHSQILKSPFSSDLFAATALLNLYSNYRCPDNALQVFNEIPHRDVAAWNAMIVGLAGMDSNRSVFLLFQRMRLDAVRPDSITIISIAQSCVREEDKEVLKAVHCIAIRIGFHYYVSVLNTLIASYAKCEDLRSAEAIFWEIPAALRSTVSWNSMIAGFGFHQMSDEAAAYFTEMRRNGTSFDLSTVLSLLAVFGHSEDLVLGMLIHSLAIKSGFYRDIRVSNTLISLYSKTGDIGSARRCFDCMEERNRVSWTTIIGGYSKSGNFDETVGLLREMVSSGETPDAVTVAAVLPACGSSGSIEFGRLMERYAVLSKLIENMVVCNALIDMYAKCGSISDARRVFEFMNAPNVVSWTAVIAGAAMNGDFEEALTLFYQMIKEKIKPNHVTFLAVLRACTHGGLLDKGKDFFDMMLNVYCMKPRLEHYACMADLLGRRGHLTEALEFIRRIPFEPDCGVWGTLLGSCITHREAEIGEYAAKRLFELDSNSIAPYVAMSNIYASNERWEGAAEVRLMMRKKGLRKCAGRSIVEVNGKTHSFIVDDRTHPEFCFIYGVLIWLALHLKVEQQMEGNLGELLPCVE